MGLKTISDPLMNLQSKLLMMNLIFSLPCFSEGQCSKYFLKIIKIHTQTWKNAKNYLFQPRQFAALPRPRLLWKIPIWHGFQTLRLLGKDQFVSANLLLQSIYLHNKFQDVLGRNVLKSLKIQLPENSFFQAKNCWYFFLGMRYTRIRFLLSVTFVLLGLFDPFASCCLVVLIKFLLAKVKSQPWGRKLFMQRLLRIGFSINLWFMISRKGFTDEVFFLIKMFWSELAATCFHIFQCIYLCLSHNLIQSLSYSKSIHFYKTLHQSIHLIIKVYIISWTCFFCFLSKCLRR